SEIKEVVKFTEDHALRDGKGTFVTVGGFATILTELVDAIVNGQAMSLSLSLFLVALLVGLLFRSVAAAFIASIPLVMSMVLLFGLMGYLDIELNIPTAMLSSMMVGIGVDYTIHFLWRYRDERARGNEPLDAIMTTLTTTGRGIVFNALSVIVGFSAMFASAFLPVRFFGFLVVVSIGTCLVGALVLMPALLLLLRPRFLEPVAADE
ncbi:MAG: MMPL family transporter, partial [Deltaproteobacteria bacterium]|nr:MMPL family transporter [Deltaproteobacteria bacterium]